MHINRLKPSIGVTGITTKEEATQVQKLFRRICHERLHGKKTWTDLMLGTLVSSKTLDGKTDERATRYPKVDTISSLPVFSCSGSYNVRNLVHYSTDDVDSLPDQIDILLDYMGTDFNGLQFNICWPKPEYLWWAGSKKGFTVLQIGSRALDEIDHDPGQLVSRVASYLRFATEEVDLIDAVLFDTSGGRGEPFDPFKILPFVEALVESRTNIGIGVAGGLSGEKMHLAETIIDSCQNVSVDAEGQLRDDDGKGGVLNLESARSYLDEAVSFYAPYLS